MAYYDSLQVQYGCRKDRSKGPVRPAVCSVKAAGSAARDLLRMQADFSRALQALKQGAPVVVRQMMSDGVEISGRFEAYRLNGTQMDADKPR